jgi:Ger(x)C family germination protein
MNIRQRLLIFPFLCLLLTTGGCAFDARELDHRSMIVGMAVDKGEDNKFLVSFQLPILGGGEEVSPRQKDFEVISSADDSVLGAIANLEAVTPRVLFFGHLKVVTISEEVAKEGIEEILEVLERNPQIGNQVYLVIIEGHQAKKFIASDTPVVTLPALYADTFFKADQKMSRTKEIKAFEYTRDAHTVTETAFIPIARISEGGEVKIQDLAAVKNNKMVSKIRGDNVAMARLLKERKISNMRSKVTIRDEKGGEIEVNLTRINLKQKIRFKKTNPVEFNLRITGQAEVRGRNKEKGISTEENLDKIEKNLNEDIEKKMHKVISEMQQTKVEPFLLGQYLFAMDTNYYDTLNWNETGWQKAKFTISVDTKVVNTGTQGVFDKKKVGR